MVYYKITLGNCELGCPPDAAAVPKLIKLGMTPSGARQLISGQIIHNAKDRQLVASILTAVAKQN